MNPLYPDADIDDDFLPPEDYRGEEEDVDGAFGGVYQGIQIAPSQFVEMAIQVPDSATRSLTPFSFAERPYLRAIYDTPAQRRLLLCGRQVEKSSYLGNMSLTLACTVPHFKVLYVSPSSTQTKVFSKDRLREPMETSSVLGAWFPGRLTDNVFEKRALNRSTITLRYAYLNADRCRGIPSDAIFIDEFQDILLHNIPVIEECASHSPFRIFSYSGTPKSLDNPIQYYWDTYSTQNEWAVPCERHGVPGDPGSWHWNILGEANIGTDGLICDRCSHLISPRHPQATWVSMGFPDRKYDIYEGFRIPQLMVPWIPWQDILTKYASMPRPRFFNEVMGLSFDSGQRPLTRQDLLDNCDQAFPMTASFLAHIRSRISGNIYAGVDWGQDSTNSYTVLAIGAYVDGFFRILYLHRFTGVQSDPQTQLEYIKKLMEALRISIIGVDYGGGYWPNAELLKNYGSQRVLRYQATNPGVFMQWDSKKNRFIFHKAEVMAAVFNAIKRRSVFRFPRAEDFMNPFGSDCLSIFSEYNETERMTEFKKSVNTTDDSFFAILFCFLASMTHNPRVDVFVPSAHVDRLQLG